MKRAQPARTSGITLKGEGATDEGIARAIGAQRDWAYRIAAGVERGELPQDEFERGVIAGIIRIWADQLRTPKLRKRGNPKFERKLPDDDTIPLSVGVRIALGDEPKDAINYVADRWEVDDTTVAKMFRARRAAVANFFAHSNLRHRVGAIRGD